MTIKMKKTGCLSWFLSIFIKPKLPEGVEKFEGNAICHSCGKRMKRNHYRINDGDYYYCRDCVIQEWSNPPKVINKKRSSKEPNIEIIKTPCSKKLIRANIQRTKLKGECEFCGERVSDGIDAFYCKYCRKWHCSEHRLPEQHNCKNPKTPKGMTGSVISYSRE